MSLTQAIKAQARELGFELVGVAPVEVVPELTFYKEWVEAGYAGKMAYMERNIEKRMDVRQVVPAAKSVIVCGMVYHTPQRLSTCSDSQRGWISRYAWGDDYHDVLKTRLLHLAAFAENEVDGQMTWRAYVDTGPVVERVFAKYAGLGWFGKNTCLINQQEGSWFFIGEIITDLELEYDTPAPDRCGTCNRCIDACPTDAILEPYLLDARRCISYLTIELRETIPTPLRAGMGNHVFGCDICQDVCPWNRTARFTREESFHPRDGLVEPDLEELAGLSQEAFNTRFKGSPVKRSKRDGLLRNVAVAMGNSGEEKFLPVLRKLAQEESPLVAEHAQWAMGKIGNADRDEN